jgi:hypothetical protein
VNSPKNAIEQSSIPAGCLIQSAKQNQSEQRCKDGSDESMSQFHWQVVTLQYFPTVALISGNFNIHLQSHGFFDFRLHQTRELFVFLDSDGNYLTTL